MADVIDTAGLVRPINEAPPPVPPAGSAAGPGPQKTHDTTLEKPPSSPELLLMDSPDEPQFADGSGSDHKEMQLISPSHSSGPSEISDVDILKEYPIQEIPAVIVETPSADTSPANGGPSFKSVALDEELEINAALAAAATPSAAMYDSLAQLLPSFPNPSADQLRHLSYRTGLTIPQIQAYYQQSSSSHSRQNKTARQELSQDTKSTSVKNPPAATPAPKPVVDEFEQKLSPLVNESGAILSLEKVPEFAALMKTETSVKNQSLLWTVILATRSPQCRRKLVELGGATVLSEWLQKAKKESKGLTTIRQVLKVLECLPMNIDALKASALGKVVKAFKSHPDQEIAQRSDRLMNSWVSLVAGPEAAPSATPAPSTLVVSSVTVQPLNLTADKKRIREDEDAATTPAAPATPKKPKPEQPRSAHAVPNPTTSAPSSSPAKPPLPKTSPAKKAAPAPPPAPVMTTNVNLSSNDDFDAQFKKKSIIPDHMKRTPPRQAQKLDETPEATEADQKARKEKEAYTSKPLSADEIRKEKQKQKVLGIEKPVVPPAGDVPPVSAAPPAGPPEPPAPPKKKVSWRDQKGGVLVEKRTFIKEKKTEQHDHLAFLRAAQQEHAFERQQLQQTRDRPMEARLAWRPLLRVQVPEDCVVTPVETEEVRAQRAREAESLSEPVHYVKDKPGVIDVSRIPPNPYEPDGRELAVEATATDARCIPIPWDADNGDAAKLVPTVSAPAAQLSSVLALLASNPQLNLTPQPVAQPAANPLTAQLLAANLLNPGAQQTQNVNLASLLATQQLLASVNNSNLQQQQQQQQQQQLQHQQQLQQQQHQQHQQPQQLSFGSGFGSSAPGGLTQFDYTEPNRDRWSTPRRKIPCTFFAQGHCKRGNECGYLHDPALVGSVQPNNNKGKRERDWN